MMQRRSSRLHRGAFAALSVALLIGQPISAAAQDKPAEKAPEKNTKAKNVMTRDELRVCLTDQDRLQQIAAKVKTEQTELNRQRAEIERIDAELAGSAGTVDPNYRASHEALKKERARRDELANAYNAQLASVREQSASYESGRNNWTERCASRGYDPKDEAAIRLEQKRDAAEGGKKQ